MKASFHSEPYATSNRNQLLRRYAWRRFVSRFTAKAGQSSIQPVVIGGLGGSGTRSLVRILRRAGVWMGNWTDPATEDALAMRAFLIRWFEPIYVALARNSKAPPDADHSFTDAIRVHCMGLPSTEVSWGWKNPRSMWLIPFYARFYLGMKFIHILRDARDMALSDNRFLLSSHGDALLGKDWRENPLRAQLDLWERGNTFARNSAERLLAPDRYLPLRYEDLCLSPKLTLRRLLEFVAAPDPEALASECASLIVPSPRIGSWKTATQAEVRDVGPAVSNALKRFGSAER